MAGFWLHIVYRCHTGGFLPFFVYVKNAIFASPQQTSQTNSSFEPQLILNPPTIVKHRINYGKIRPIFRYVTKYVDTVYFHFCQDLYDRTTPSFLQHILVEVVRQEKSKLTII